MGPGKAVPHPSGTRCHGEDTTTRRLQSEAAPLCPSYTLRCTRALGRLGWKHVLPHPLDIYRAPTLCQPALCSEQSRHKPSLPSQSLHSREKTDGEAWQAFLKEGSWSDIYQAHPRIEALCNPHPHPHPCLVTRPATARMARAELGMGWGRSLEEEDQVEEPSPLQKCHRRQCGWKGQGFDSANCPPTPVPSLPPWAPSWTALRGFLSASRLPLPEAAGGLCASSQSVQLGPECCVQLIQSQLQCRL